MFQFIQRNNYEATQLDDEWIILNTDNYTITRVNDLGGFCWLMLDKPQTVVSIHKEIIKNFETSTNEKDIESFLNHLVEYGLVQYAS